MLCAGPATLITVEVLLTTEPSTIPDTEELTAFRYQWKEELGLAAPTKEGEESERESCVPQSKPEPSSPERAALPRKPEQSPPEQVASQPLNPKDEVRV